MQEADLDDGLDGATHDDLRRWSGGILLTSPPVRGTSPTLLPRVAPRQPVVTRPTLTLTRGAWRASHRQSFVT